MNFDFFDGFSDPYLKTDSGRGVFSAGVVLGMLAKGQSNGSAIDSSPIFKQMNFGRMKKRDVAKHMSRVPELTRAYHLKYAELIEALTAYSGELLMKGTDRELGVDGNFIFSMAFLNANKYFWTIFKKKDKDEKVSDNLETKGDA